MKRNVLAMYQAALDDPAADWKAIAGLLASSLPKPRKAKASKHGRWPMVLVDVAGWQMATSTPWKGDGPDLEYAKAYALGWFRRKCLREPGVDPVVVKMWLDAGDYWEKVHDHLFPLLQAANVRFEASPQAIEAAERDRRAAALERRREQDRAIMRLTVLTPEFIAEGKAFSERKRRMVQEAEERALAAQAEAMEDALPDELEAD